MSTSVCPEPLSAVRNTLLDLISSCEQGFDDRDLALIRLAFHDEAVLDLGVLFGRHDGLDAILATADEVWAGTPYMHHWLADPLLQIDLAAGMATASTGIDCLFTLADRGTFQCEGRYEDVFERIGGRWAIIERRYEAQLITLMPDWEPAPALA
jgi:hypothetical protein